MKSFSLSIFAIIFSTSYLYGETNMAPANSALISQTDETALSNSAKEIVRAYEAVIEGELHSSEANVELYQLIASDVVAASIIYATTGQENQLSSEGGAPLISSDTANLIAQIQRDTPHFADKIAASVWGDQNVASYLRQLGNINTELLSRSPSLIAPELTLVENFKSYQMLVSPIERALGYINYEATFERQDFWPNGDYFQGNAKFINLFRTSEAEKLKSLAFMAFFDSLPPNEQLAAYAWVYSASFETYLTVASVPSDLPPWITSENLRALHRNVNDSIMAEFEEKETEMMQ